MVRPFQKIWMSIFFVFINFMAGCTSLSLGQKNEPSLIIIRNNASFNIEQVSIRGIKKHGRHSRVGMISPLPKGVSQVIGRPTNPPELPRELLICWVAEAEKENCKQKNIREVLKGVAGSGTALVFEIRSQSDAKIYLENTH